MFTYKGVPLRFGCEFSGRFCEQYAYGCIRTSYLAYKLGLRFPCFAGNFNLYRFKWSFFVLDWLVRITPASKQGIRIVPRRIK